MKRKISTLILIFQILLSLLPFPVLGAEPTLPQLERATLRYAGMETEEVVKWKSRARWAAAMPKVMVGFEQRNLIQVNNTIQDSISVSSAGVTLGPPESSFKEDNNFNRGFEVKATWDLNELVFNRDSLNISAENRYRVVVRGQILDELHQVYFERKRILLRKNEGDFPINSRLRLEELEAKLDSLTGGYFSKVIHGGEENGK